MTLPAPAKRNSVMVTNAAVVSGLGPNLDTLWRRLLVGETAIRPLERFPTDRYNVRNAAWIAGLEFATGPSLLFPLLERLLEGFGPVPADCRLITATTKGCIDILERLQRGLPADPGTLPVSSVLSWINRKFGLADQGVNVNAACASSTIAVARAAALIAAGKAEAVLVVCMDLVSEFVFSGFSALQALSPTTCRPFDRDRNGLALGEGGAALLLMSEERACRENRRALGTVAGWGAANDATHITAPAREGCGLVQAVRQALAKAGITPDDVAAVSAHGTGTVYNDLMELTAFRAVFGDRPVPVHSVKGAIGHTLGAAGGIEVALGLMSLKSRVVPPTAGFREPDENVPGQVSARPQPMTGPYLLTTNSGFGGVNAALVLKGEVP